MRCPRCGEKLLSRGSFELFIENGIEEKYKCYPCNNHYLDTGKTLNYRVELLEESEKARMPDTAYKRYRARGETTTPCPECGEMLDHVSNDETFELDWIFYHKRYACRGTPNHVIRILIERLPRGSEENI